MQKNMARFRRRYRLRAWSRRRFSSISGLSRPPCKLSVNSAVLAYYDICVILVNPAPPGTGTHKMLNSLRLSSLALLTLGLLARLPLGLLQTAGALVTLSVLPWRKRALDMRTNLEQAGLYSRGLALQAYAGQGRSMAESLAVWLRPYDQAVGLVREVSGWEHVEAARAEGRGVVALMPHLGSWEMGALYAGSRMPILFLYRPPRQAWADRLMRRGRERGGLALATPDTRGVRAMLKTLKQGGAVGVLPDQVASKGDGVWAAFFGRPAYTPTLAFRLIQATGAVPLLFFCERLAWGRGYRMQVMPLKDLPEDHAGAALRLNTAIEDLIRRHPEQYFWSYRRYKQPQGAPPPEASP